MHDFIYNLGIIGLIIIFSSQYQQNLEIMKKDPSIKILNHGLTGYRDWEKWGN